MMPVLQTGLNYFCQNGGKKQNLRYFSGVSMLVSALVSKDDLKPLAVILLADFLWTKGTDKYVK